MKLRHPQQPETMAEIILAALEEKNPQRKLVYEEKLKNINSELLIGRLAELIVTERRGMKKAAGKTIVLFLSGMILLSLPMLLFRVHYWDWLCLINVIVLAFPSVAFNICSIRKNRLVSLAIKKVVALTNRANSGACVGSILDILNSGVDEEQKRELLECLQIPLSRIDSEEIALITLQRLETLEKIVLTDSYEPVALAGLLVLGSARYQVREWETVVSWSKPPTRQGAAAREYLLSVGGMVR